MNETQKLFLAHLYTIVFSGQGDAANFSEWADEQGFTREEVRRVYDELKEAGLVRSPVLGPFAAITSEGVLFVEKTQLVDSDLIEKQQSVRTQLLDVLAMMRDMHGIRKSDDWEQVAQNANVAPYDFRRNIAFLKDTGYIEFVSARQVRITARGYESVCQWRERTGLSERFFALRDDASVKPQVRGHELEKLLEELAQREEWQTERNVRSPGEETDIIFYQGFDYFLVSCKWEKAAVETKDIRDLHSRISARPSTRGVLFSMSGFSRNAIEEAARRMESAVLLLFGPKDVADLFDGKATLTSLLREKLHAVMTRRKIIIDQVIE